MSRLDPDNKNLEDESIAGKSFVFIKKTFQEIAAKEDWSSLAFPDIKKALQEKSILPENLSKPDVEKLKLLVEQYTQEHSQGDSQKKKNSSTELEDDRQKKKSKHSAEKESSKTKKTNSKHKSKKHKYSSESNSEDSISESKSEPKKRKKVKIDLNDPQVKKIEALKKVIRGCGVSLTGYTNKHDAVTLKKLQKIISEHEKDGMKENMSRKQMIKVRNLIGKQREIEELKNIPKKLIVQAGSARDRRKTKKKSELCL